MPHFAVEPTKDEYHWVHHYEADASDRLAPLDEKPSIDGLALRLALAQSVMKSLSDAESSIDGDIEDRRDSLLEFIMEAADDLTSIVSEDLNGLYVKAKFIREFVESDSDEILTRLVLSVCRDIEKMAGAKA